MVKNIISFLGLIILFSCNNTGKHTDYKPLTLGILTTDHYNPASNSTGLKVTVVRFETPVERNTALASGKIDGIVTDFVDAALLAASGTPMQIVMRNDTNYRLVTGIGKNIRSVKQLKGRNIAVEKNTIIEYITDRILSSANIPTNSGINKADIKRASLRLNLLQNGLIDAAVLPGKYAEIAISQGNYMLVSLQDTNIPIVVTLFSDHAWKEKEKAIKAFAKKHKTSPPSTKDMNDVNQWLRQKGLIH